MPEMPEMAAKLLDALVEIEDQAIELARIGGCRCNAEAEGVNRPYPYASFDRNECVGKEFTEIPYRMQHEPGCPMEGQRGVGFASDPKCWELSPETERPCYLNKGHRGAHEAMIGPASIASWAHTIQEVDNAGA